MSDTLKTTGPKLKHDTGAPSELRAIEHEVAAIREDRDNCLAVYMNSRQAAIDNPPEEDGTDYDHLEKVAKRHLDDAEERLTASRKLLREFTKIVPDEKRDSSEKITREYAQSVLAMIVVYQRQALRALITTFCDSLLACKTQIDVHHLMESKFCETLRNAVESANREGHVPKWWADALEGII